MDPATLRSLFPVTQTLAYLSNAAIFTERIHTEAEIDRAIDTLVRASTKEEEMQILTVPGLWNSGPQHWQTHWEQKHPDWKRVQQRDWNRPYRNEWIDALDRAISDARAPVVLAAHSLGCALVAEWSADRGGRGVAGAFLVAPSDVEAPGYPEEGRCFAAMPRQRLPFRSVVIASTNDEYVTVDRARSFAESWGSEIIFIGDAGHIYGASGYGPWPAGEAMFLDFCERIA